MNQSTRLILAFVLSIGIMFGYYTYFAPQPLPVAPNTPVQTTPPPVAVTPGTPSLLSTPDTMANVVATVPAKDIIVVTSVATAVVTTRGGVITSYELSHYKKDVSEKSAAKNLITEQANSQALFLGLKGIPGFNENSVFEVAADNTLENGVREIVLTWTGNGFVVEKKFVFGTLTSPYAAKVLYKVTNTAAVPVIVAPYLSHALTQKADEQSDSWFSFLMAGQSDLFSRYYYKDNALTYEADWKGFAGGETATGNITWSGISDRYFLYALIPSEINKATATVGFDREGERLIGKLIYAESTLNPQTSINGEFDVYLGPKLLGEMSKLGVMLEKSVDYGWFSILAVPILWLMTFLHGFIPNWGLVIIMLTFIIKIALTPVNNKSMKSMKAMQQLQPKLTELREKFANDKEKQNQAMMNLFRTHKVNPMSGCLPMVLQMPIYIVLYKVLWNAIELYHAPFFGPYKDLSAPDPYFISPILLGVFMFLQQKLTPSPSADPAQKNMMMIMPIMFTGLMLFLPVGLVVYIFVNTVMSVVQQYMMKHDISFKDLVTGKWQPNGA